MWKCTHCPEQLEDDYDICWNCGYARDGSSPESRQVNNSLSSKKKASHISISGNDDAPQKKIEEVESRQVNNSLSSKKKASHISISDNDAPQQIIQQMVVVDVSMPFLSMVVFMVKWTIASIPAAIILMIIFSAIFLPILKKFF